MSIPVVTEKPLGPDGNFSLAWRNWLSTLGPPTDTAALEASIAAIQAELDALGGGVSVVGQYSVRATGTDTYYLTLVNDQNSPGETYYYGTGPDGIKGWFSVSDALEIESGELTKAVGSDGVTTFGLADVADAGGGTLQRTAFDAKGRKTGTSAATAADLPFVPAGGISATDVQAAIVEAASTGAGGCCEILVSDTNSAPPVMLTNEAEDDFLYSD